MKKQEIVEQRPSCWVAHVRSSVTGRKRAVLRKLQVNDQSLPYETNMANGYSG